MTAPIFHRLVVPVYTGGLPANYDYLNNAVSGTPASANPVLAAGPNAGSYFVGFADDGTSADANRPAQALGTNTDFLDNLFRQDLAVVTRTADVGPTGSPTATVTLTGPNIWMGNSGGYLLRDLFHIVDSNDQDIIAGGSAVVVASFTGGSIGGGFSTGNLVLTLNASIPTGTQYHVYYGTRTNLATLPMDALILPIMRDEGNASANIANFVSQVSAPGVLGSNVTSLQAASFSTPDGHSLAKSSTFVLDCDPTESGATFRKFIFRTREASVNRTVATLYDDPTSSIIPGLTGLFQLDTGVAFSSAGALSFEDLNTSTGGPIGVSKYLPLTGASNGDSFPRVMEQPPPASYSAVAPSLLQLINGRWACTCGDGTLSFGDFNGPGALDAALTYASAQGITSFHIQLKRGNYTLTGGYAITGDALIEGVSMGQTVITTAVTGAADFLGTFAPGRTTLKNLSFVYGSGIGRTITIDVASGRLDGVALTGITLFALNAVSVNGIAAVRCTGCVFTPSAAGFVPYSVLLEVGDGTALHTGFVFEGCSWICADETGPVQIQYAGPNATAIGGILFKDCAYTLGGTATTAGHLTTNTGVLSINPNGSNSLLTVNDVTWENCTPSGSSTATNSVLARVYAVALGDNSASHFAIVKSLTLRGGTWSCNTNNSSAISQFLMAAQNITVEDTVFINSGGTSGGPSSEDQYILGLPFAFALRDWHQFIFATPGGSSPFPNCLRMSNVLFNGQFNTLSNAGDLWLYLNGYVEIDGLRLQGYFNGGGGPDTLPDARVRITPGTTQGYIKGLSLRGNNPGAGNTFTAFTNAGNAGLVVVEPSATNTQSLEFEKLVIEGFAYSGNFDDGIVLVNPGTGTPNWPFWFTDCRVTNCLNGLVMYGGSVGQGGTGQPLDNFGITGGNFSGNHGYGIFLSPDNIGIIHLDRITNQGNGSHGLMVTPVTWINPSESCLTVRGNTFAGNNSNGAQAAFLSSGSASNNPHIIFKDNACLTSSGALATVQFQHENSIALPSTGTPGSTVNFCIFGVHTGISAIGVAPTLDYGSGNLMMENMAELSTP